MRIFSKNNDSLSEQIAQLYEQIEILKKQSLLYENRISELEKKLSIAIANPPRYVYHDSENSDSTNYADIDRQVPPVYTSPEDYIEIQKLETKIYSLGDIADTYFEKKEYSRAVETYKKRNDLLTSEYFETHHGWSDSSLYYELTKYSIALMASGETVLADKSLDDIGEYIIHLQCSRQAEQFNRSIDHARTLETDFLEMSVEYPCCEECSRYQGRIYSISGTSLKFPPLPDSLKQHGYIHPGCHHSFIPFIAGATFKAAPEGVSPDQWSRRPFIDERSEEDKQIYENIRNNEYKQISTMKNKLNYYWLQLNLPELTPKSFNAYSRMKNANTATFRAIQDAARSKGREI